MAQPQGMAAWSLVCHLSHGATQGRACIVRHAQGRTTVVDVPAGAPTGAPDPLIFLGTTRDDRVILLEPRSKEILVRDALPEDAVPAYAYREPDGRGMWFMNDGDEETGCDELNCGTTGSSVTVVRRGADDDSPAAYVQTVCVGRGHHVTTFTGPSPGAPRAPRRAFVSNLMDGSISVIACDPQAADYLRVIETINLLDPRREKGDAAPGTNNAFPHGMVYSPLSGKLYSLNNGYATVDVIDPLSAKIEKTVPLSVSSNLLLSPDGGFIVAKGADRKSDPDHVIGRLTVLTAAGELAGSCDLTDLYPSTYRFNADGTRLYVTSAATGKGGQRDRLKTGVVLVFDSSHLPRLTLLKEVAVGRADCGRRPIAFLATPTPSPCVFVSNPSDGSLTVLDGRNEAVLETVTLSDRPVEEINFSFWDPAVTGA